MFGVVPAAGRSRRMGRAKQLLDVGGRGMLVHLLESLAAAQVEGTVVVTHAAVAAKIAGHMPPRTQVAINADPRSGMIDSVRLGLAAWLEREAVDERDGFLVCPGDHPGISVADFDACIASFREAAGHIVIATYGARRGHPLVFPAGLADFVRSAACDAGLNALSRAHAHRVVTVPCRSLGVIRDVDSPQDYEALREESPG